MGECSTRYRVRRVALGQRLLERLEHGIVIDRCLVRYAWHETGHRAPKGGVRIKSKFFKGGEFIPAEVLAQATPEEKKKIKPVSARSTSAIGLASPETGSGLDFPHASHKAGLKHQEHWRKRFQDIDHELGLRSTVQSVVGEWAPEGQSPGAEPSTLSIYKGLKDYDTLKYAMARKGLLREQIQVIPFMKDQKGKDSLWRIDLEDSIENVRANLDHHKLAYRTLQNLGGGKVRVYIFDPETQLTGSVQKLSGAYDAQPEQIKGRGEFWPPETEVAARLPVEKQTEVKRRAAVNAYKAFIKEFEAGHKTGARELARHPHPRHHRLGGLGRGRYLQSRAPA